jgi:hypothetical protein
MSESIPEPAGEPDETAHAVDPVAGRPARHRVALDLPCTVASLRNALRRMNGTDQITDVWLQNDVGEVSLDGLTGFDMSVRVSE